MKARRTLFVAMTRAMRALLVVTPLDDDSMLYDGFDPELWNTAMTDTLQLPERFDATTVDVADLVARLEARSLVLDWAEVTEADPATLRALLDAVPRPDRPSSRTHSAS